MSDKPERVDGHLVQGMGWSTERPKVAGWYWSRRDGKISAVEVRWEPTDSDGHGTFDVRGDNLLWSLESFPGEWSGPIPLPTDAPAQGWYKAEEVEAREKKLLEMLREAHGRFGQHNGHWDKTGGSGTGCPVCVAQRELYERHQETLARLRKELG